MRKRRRGRKLLLSLAALGAAASIAGMATYATFTSSVSQSQTISSGTVSLNLGATGAATNRLNIGASNIAPGDTMQRSVDLINGGTINLASITLTNDGDHLVAARHRRGQWPSTGHRQVLAGMD